MKFKNKKGVIIETHNNFEEKILRGNPNYTEVKETVENIEEKPQKSTKKGGNKPS